MSFFAQTFSISHNVCKNVIHIHKVLYVINGVELSFKKCVTVVRRCTLLLFQYLEFAHVTGYDGQLLSHQTIFQYIYWQHRVMLVKYQHHTSLA